MSLTAAEKKESLRSDATMRNGLRFLSSLVRTVNLSFIFFFSFNIHRAQMHVGAPLSPGREQRCAAGVCSRRTRENPDNTKECTNGTGRAHTEPFSSHPPVSERERERGNWNLAKMRNPLLALERK